MNSVNISDCWVFSLGKLLGIECTLEAETSVSNLTQYKLFIGDDKNNMPFGVTFFNICDFYTCLHNLLLVLNHSLSSLDFSVRLKPVTSMF